MLHPQTCLLTGPAECRACWDGPDCGCAGFPAEIPLEKHQNKEISSLSGTVNHSWVYHRNPGSVNMSQEGKLKVSPTHGSKNNIIIASFTATGVCRAEEEICSITFLMKEHGQGLLTLCISQWIIAWTPEHETGGSANRLREAVRGRNQLCFLFIHSLPPPCLCLPLGSVLPPPPALLSPPAQGDKPREQQHLPPGAGAPASPRLPGACWGASTLSPHAELHGGGHPAATGNPRHFSAVQKEGHCSATSEALTPVDT